MGGALDHGQRMVNAAYLQCTQQGGHTQGYLTPCQTIPWLLATLHTNPIDNGDEEEEEEHEDVVDVVNVVVDDDVVDDGGGDGDGDDGGDDGGDGGCDDIHWGVCICTLCTTTKTRDASPSSSRMLPTTHLGHANRLCTLPREEECFLGCVVGKLGISSSLCGQGDVLRCLCKSMGGHVSVHKDNHVEYQQHQPTPVDMHVDGCT